ncbi:MAG: type II toxin-antitoxin system YafQ family toxin [Nitrospinae bacterium]|nr:type II toxin-antitoxin system YafQ family toxin [Nitrospinota bacterium]
MLLPVYTKQFKKEIKKIKKSGHKDIEKLKTVMETLIDEKPLDRFYKDHPLKGNFKERRECHIEPNWLLIYMVNKKEKTIIFERTGTHSDLFE